MNVQISFCITCMGRLAHLKETLPINLRDNPDIPSIEFVLLDYSSPDGVGDWVRRNMMPHLITGRLVYCFAGGFQYFHMAHAKNVAHRLARGKIVCNLDADNFTGSGFADYLFSTLAGREKIMVRSSSGKGAHGRIAMRKTDFEALGGYDERMELGWGGEDRDLLRRGRKAGIKDHLIPSDSPWLVAIQHNNSERTKHNRIQDKRASAEHHRLLSKESIERGELVANRGKNWGAAVIRRNFQDQIIL